MYLVGIIPGPNKPPPDQLNHFLAPLIKDLLLFWKPSVRISRTADYPQGRVIHATLIPVVSNLPVAQKVGGSAGVMVTRFCALCLCKRHTYHGVNPSKWSTRSWEKWKAQVKAWKEAISVHHWNTLFKKYGVRWMPLLDLPYWDLSQFVVVDSMHNLFLRLFKNHCPQHIRY
ncbi:hypothetical protein K439DRAFT_1645589 [Ramaria rubella]|nr:hypothetical protein K439DRAFT_1645589 [Ramaria rubella]